MQLYSINGPLLPNLTTLDLWAVGKLFIPVIPLLLSPTITSISFAFCVPLPPKSMVASVVTSLPILCPNLQDIHLLSLPKDPIITAAVSRMVLAPNRNALRKFRADSPLTEEAREAISKSQNLRNLSVVIEKGTSIPSASLPNLTYLKIECEDGSGGLQLLRGATFGKLESVNFYFRSKPVGGFLEAFKDAALSSTIQNTLFVIHFFTGWSWYPDYSSLLPFTRLVHLTIWSTCDENCSNVDDNIIIDLSRVMPELEFLQLGDAPCRQFAGGVTARGLVALAENCLGLSSLVVHFQVATLSDPPTCLGTICSAEHSASWTDCALMDLEVGNIPVPESISMVALTLLRIFPRIETISCSGGAWDEVEDVIRRSKGIIDCSSKYHYLTIPRNFSQTLLRSQPYDQ